ncbi:hypothetical protein EYF80_037245 [Liparis tanakae]|uniref:Uncharacterized protein n=1 Tax=Liparis tanakae TaxID=230148 RepID=A0A4Z2GG82_9TELE|nr:hypothetical protein EYF80_037245 [Liparis tanakae]
MEERKRQRRPVPSPVSLQSFEAAGKENTANRRIHRPKPTPPQDRPQTIGYALGLTNYSYTKKNIPIPGRQTTTKAVPMYSAAELEGLNGQWLWSHCSKATTLVVIPFDELKHIVSDLEEPQQVAPQQQALSGAAALTDFKCIASQ